MSWRSSPARGAQRGPDWPVHEKTPPTRMILGAWAVLGFFEGSSCNEAGVTIAVVLSVPVAV